MMLIQFTDLPPDTHHCVPVYAGDWVIWLCPLCAGYERRYNVATGQMMVKGKTDAVHTGGFSLMERRQEQVFCEN